MRILVIGGVSAGMSAASQAKRRAPQAEVIAFERGAHVSYAACGMPYNIEDPRRVMDDLVVITPAEFAKERGIDVRIRHEVLAVRPDRRVIEVRDLDGCRVVDEPYDRLVVATGAVPRRPALPGVDLPGVFVLRELADGAVLKRQLDETPVREVVILGAGYVGLEMADVLRRRGLEVTLLERSAHVLPGYDPWIAQVAEETLRQHEVRVRTGAQVQRIGQGAGGTLLVVHTDHDAITADLVLLAVGVQPNVALASAAGIALGPTGAIAVDDGMRTNLPDVFAAGDCAEARHRLTGRPTWVPLGTTANKQGKIAGANAAGADEHFYGILGTAALRLFEIEIGRTGLGPRELAAAGIDAVVSHSRHRTRAHAFPGAQMANTTLFLERGTGRLLGAQMAGGDTIAKRIDVFAAALHAGMTVADIERLDLTYAPPFAPVYDPILIAATVALKDLAAQPK